MLVWFSSVVLLSRFWQSPCRRWLLTRREQVPEGSATARAVDYSLKRWQALTRYLDDGDVPIGIH